LRSRDIALELLGVGDRPLRRDGVGSARKELTNRSDFQEVIAEVG
jgi:hypothetical protein